MIGNKDVIDAFWDVVPDNLTLDELTNGVFITFKYRDVIITINTKGKFACRTRPPSAYYEDLELRVIAAYAKGLRTNSPKTS
jgi:hypothetical protein